ncbi:MAG: sugar phosphate isomerase/epimerase [Clostridia bacterium]|nr:sugar phosphate isomerase/epimerase [Clostridia bacterium]
MRIGIGSRDYYSVYDYEEGFKKIKSHGYDCVDYGDISNIDSDLYNLAGEEYCAFFKKVRESAEKSGIEIWQMHSVWPTVNFDKTEADRQKTTEYFIRQIEAAHYLDCGYFVLHPFMPFGYDVEGDYSFTFDANVDLLQKLIPYAEKWNVTLCVENLPFPNNPVSKVSEVKRLVHTVNHPRVKVCLDTGHANIFSSDIAADVRLLGDDLAALHVHDNSGWCDAHKIPYSGTIKWDEFLTALGEIGFNGCLNLESSIPIKMPEPYREEMRLSLAKLTREMVNKIK